MKKFFLPLLSLMLLLTGNLALKAQNCTAAAGANRQIVIIQKITNEDGTVTVKKKTLPTGENLETYVKSLDLDSGDAVRKEITVITNGNENVEATEGETVMHIRRGNQTREIRWNENAKITQEMNVITTEAAAPYSWKQRSGMHHPGDRPFMGIYPETTEQGVLLTGIVEGTGAEAAGLKTGDVLTAIDGKLLVGTVLSGILDEYKPGDVIAVTYLRNGATATASLTLGAQKKQEYHYNYNYDYNAGDVERDPCKVFIGVYVGSYGREEEGVGVQGIIAGWPAEEAGLQEGDRIISMDGMPVSSHRDLVLERDKHQPGDYFTIGYLRNGEPEEVKARFRGCENDQPVVEAPLAPPVVVPQPAPIDNTLQFEELNAFPNPTFGDLNVKFSGKAVPTDLTITDVNGKVIYQESLPNFDGVYNRQVDVGGASTGTLLLTVRQGGKVITQPVVLLSRA